MALRINRARSIQSLASRIDANGPPIVILNTRRWNLSCSVSFGNVCLDCRRRLFTQTIRGKRVPFFQRNLTSTPNSLTATPGRDFEDSASASRTIVASVDEISQPAAVVSDAKRVRKFRTKSKGGTLSTLLELGKPRLSALIVLSTMSTYAISPFPGSLPTLLFLASGTYLCCNSANTFNMMAEPHYDGLMSRTRNRPLVRKAVTQTQAAIFGILTGVSGLSILAIGVNPTVAILGASNIILYAAIYTPLKRTTILNTWVGAVVGGIPPLMGWAACSPEASLLSHPGGLLLAGLLYAWQFPHFNSLAYTMRNDYARAGYKMMSVTHPDLNARVALRYSIAIVPLCWGLVACGLVDQWYLLDSTIVNGWVVWRAWQFWKDGGEGGRARKLFFAGLIQLPAVLVLAMLHKVGLWDWIWETEDEDVDNAGKSKEEAFDDMKVA